MRQHIEDIVVMGFTELPDNRKINIVASIGEDIEAFAPIRHIEKEDGDKLVVGDTASFRVLEFSKENRRLLVSHTSTFREEEIQNKKQAKVAAERAVKKIQQTQQKSTLGDLDSLTNLKKDLENKGE